MGKIQKKIQIIIGLAIVVLITLYFVQKQTHKVTTEEKSIVDTSENTNTPTVTQDNETEVTTEFSQPNKEEFNMSMTNARNAFIAKDYQQSLKYYNQALTYNNSDTVYAGMYTTYSAQGNWTQAIESLDKAIKINPSFTDYWKWKVDLMDQKTSATFSEIQKVYQEGLKVVNSATKVNLVTTFARIAENNSEKNIAIATWKEAIKLQPQAQIQFQAEIDRLSK